MARVKYNVASKKRKKRVLKQAKGQFGQRSKRYRQAQRSILKSMVYAYRDRKAKKREYRALWIVRIKAACEINGIKYSRFMNGLKAAKIDLNRKMLAEIAARSPEAFQELAKTVKAVLGQTAGA